MTTTPITFTAYAAAYGIIGTIAAIPVAVSNVAQGGDFFAAPYFIAIAIIGLTLATARTISDSYDPESYDKARAHSLINRTAAAAVTASGVYLLALGFVAAIGLGVAALTGLAAPTINPNVFTIAALIVPLTYPPIAAILKP